MRPQPNRRLGVGIAASLAAHILLLLAFRADSLRELVTEPSTQAKAMLVWIKPKPPLPEPERIVERRPSDTPSRAKPAASKRTAQDTSPATDQDSEDASVPQPLIAVDRSTVPDPFYVQPAPQEKTFDMAAARAAARRVATSADPARADLPVGQFDKERNRVKPQPSKEARAIASAERPDCKDGIPGPLGGLLSPLNLLMDKKDHGCKW
ncbi:hypothetical protein [Pseudoduganella sp. GCM10020061]|uniref:hypothetical protein n=1 Tax=Pseudoduganella sp. GCM10020061 TaxID=3317345 RepID=UPI0036349456